MKNGIRFEGNAAFAEVPQIQEAGKQLRKLVKTAYDAHLDQATIVRFIDAFTASLSAPGITNSSISGATITDKHREKSGT